MTADRHRTMEMKWRAGRWVRRVAMLVVLVIVIVPSGVSQKPAPSPSPTPPLPPTPPVFRDEKAPDYGPRPERALTFEDVQYMKFIVQRLQSMSLDTTKLLKLARELNAKVKESGPESLTKEDLHTLAEIEKLAHAVKWKMQSATMVPPPR